MSADEQTITGEHWPREITPEEAAKLRAHYLALAREAAREKTRPEQDSGDSESTDATVAAFVLPGD
jgi:hypothetical protein